MRYLIVDMTNQFIRSWIVAPQLDNDGRPIGGVIGSLQIIQKVIKKTVPDRVIIVWDEKGGSDKRKAINENYKGNRGFLKPLHSGSMTNKEIMSNRFWQEDRVREYLSALPFLQFKFAGVEADDVIAQIKNRLPDDEKIIMSADHDMFQLLDKKTLVYKPTPRKTIEDKMLNTFDMIKEYGIHPNNFALAKAVAGDNSDNIKGIKRVGFKTLLKEFPEFSKSEEISAAKLVAMANEKRKTSKKKIFENLAENLELLEENYSIIQLKNPYTTDHIEFEFKDLREKEVRFDKNRFLSMFENDKIKEMFYITLIKACDRIIKAI